MSWVQQTLDFGQPKNTCHCVSDPIDFSNSMFDIVRQLTDAGLDEYADSIRALMYRYVDSIN